MLSLALAALLTLGGLYLAMSAGNGFLEHVSALSDVQQRMVGGGLVSFSAMILAIGGLLKRRRAIRKNEAP